MQLLQNPSLRNLLLSNVQPDGCGWSRKQWTEWERHRKILATWLQTWWKKSNSSEEKQTHRSTKTPNPKQQSCSTLTTQSWQHHVNRQLTRGIESENTCCWKHMKWWQTNQTSQQTVSQSAHTWETRIQSPFTWRLTALRHPWKWLVVHREPSLRTRNLDQHWDKLAKIREHWERMITRDTELELENWCSRSMKCQRSPTLWKTCQGNWRDRQIWTCKTWNSVYGTRWDTATSGNFWQCKTSLGSPTRWQRSKCSLTQTGPETRSRWNRHHQYSRESMDSPLEWMHSCRTRTLRAAEEASSAHSEEDAQTDCTWKQFWTISACEPRSICDVTPRQQEHWHRDKVCPSVRDTWKWSTSTCKISSKRERSKCREWRQKRTWQIWVRNICWATDDGEELRERDDVPSRPWKAIWRI